MNWEKIFIKEKAIWYYNHGDKYHVVTSHGEHMDFYLNTNYIVCNPKLTTNIVHNCFVPEIEQSKASIDWVVTYPPYGIPFAFELAKCLNSNFCYLLSRKQKECFFNIKEGENAVIVVDDIYSSRSLKNVIDFLREKKLRIHSKIFSIANFSGIERFAEVEIFSLLTKRLNRWDITECPMCKNGSNPVYHRSNWLRLIQNTISVST